MDLLLWAVICSLVLLGLYVLYLTVESLLSTGTVYVALSLTIGQTSHPIIANLLAGILVVTSVYGWVFVYLLFGGLFFAGVLNILLSREFLKLPPSLHGSASDVFHFASAWPAYFAALITTLLYSCVNHWNKRP